MQSAFKLASLPELIEIVPLTEPVNAEVAAPGSKSITNRALILAALGEGETVLEGALWSEDTQVMVESLRELGFELGVEEDLLEPCNRTIRVRGLGGRIPNGGTAGAPLELFVGNAGTAARFLAALVCLGEGYYRLSGVSRMHERPQAALFEALRELGYGVEAPGDRLPATIRGQGRRAGRCRVRIDKSSQFASALLLSSGVGGWQVEVLGHNLEESPYVGMTNQLIDVFPRRGGRFRIEPDASSGSYFWGTDWLLHGRTGNTGRITVAHWPESRWQIDAEFPKFLPLPARVSRERDLGDSIMTAIVLAPFASHAVRFTELGRLRLQECERVQALERELTRCGGKALDLRGRGEDTLEVVPGNLRGAEIETYEDHRMAMCFAILGLKIPGIKLKNPACVKKTFPNFFQKLAAPAPRGLGATILDGRTGEALAFERLFAR